MAQFEPAVEWTLKHEGNFSNNPNDSGGRTNFGITEEVAKKFGYDVLTLTVAQAKGIYRASYWRHDGIVSQRIATKAFDIGVNTGVGRGIELLQRAANRLGAGLREDGLIGPTTERAVNFYPDGTLLQALCDVQALYYAEIINVNYKARRAGKTKRDYSAFALGWMVRAVAKP